jgi:streptogramin lyase
VNGIDQRGRRAALALLQASERLGPVPGLGDLHRRRRRRSLRRAGLAAAAVVVAAALVGQATPDLRQPVPRPPGPAATPTPTARAWPGVPGLDRRVRDAVATGAACRCAGDVAAGPTGVWVLGDARGGERDRLLRVDPLTDEVVAGIPVRDRASHVRSGDDGTGWVVRLEPSPGDEELLQVDPASGSVTRTIPLPAVETGANVEAVLVAGGAVWIADSTGRLLRVDTSSGQARTVLSSRWRWPIVGLAAAAGGIWVASHYGLQRLDPEDGRVTLEVSDPALQQAMPADSLAAGAGALWMAGGGDEQSDRLLRLDPVSGRVVAALELRRAAWEATRPVVVAADEHTVVVRRGPGLFLIAADGSRLRGYLELPGDGGVAVGAGAVWATDPGRGRLLRIDPGA